MTASKREREYARQRAEKWQARQTTKQAKQRKIRQILLACIAGLGVLGLVFALANLAGKGTDDAKKSGSASKDKDADLTKSLDSANPCPEPARVKPEAPLEFPAAPTPQEADKKVSKAIIKTSCGDIAVELYGDKAPVNVANFRFLAQKNFFNDTGCHRLTVSGIFVLQCGDPTFSGTGGPGYKYGPIENAPANGNYPAGTLAMARANTADSQGSQFFLVYKDSPIPTSEAGGYSVFGKITAGLDIVQKIADGKTKSRGSSPSEQPARPIAITEVTLP